MFGLGEHGCSDQNDKNEQKFEIWRRRLGKCVSSIKQVKLVNPVKLVNLIEPVNLVKQEYLVKLVTTSENSEPINSASCANSDTSEQRENSEPTDSDSSSNSESVKLVKLLSRFNLRI